MTLHSVLIRGLHLQVFPIVEGQVFQDGKSLLIDGKSLPDRWTKSDWQAADVGSRLEFICHVAYKVSGVISQVNWCDWEDNVPSFHLVEAEFKGSLKELERGSLGRYGSFVVTNWEEATVEPDWLFPCGVSVPWETYKSIVDYLGDWEPFRPLTVSELWLCARYASDNFLPWSFENLLQAISVKGNFAIPCEVRKVHDALKLASRLKDYGWPLEEEELEEYEGLLNLWFDLSTGKWIWLKPDSLFEDHVGLSCAQFTLEELNQETTLVALKLLFPVKEPFFSVKGQVFTSTSGPA